MHLAFTTAQKKALGLLLVGTALEYFGLSLYIHITFVLNDFFVQKYDPYTASLLAAFAFCSAWSLRPLGALIFGWIGDRWGRKKTILMSTCVMAISCFVMAILPVYVQAGAGVVWGMTFCRVVQGVSSVGTILGAQAYLTEITKPPARYTAVALISGAAAFGNVLALCVAIFCVPDGFQWRHALFVGAGVGIMTCLACTQLKESHKFLGARERQKKQQSLPHDRHAHWKTYLAYLAIDSVRPFYFAFAFVYTAILLRNDFMMDPYSIIQQSWIAGMVAFLQVVCLIVLTTKLHPMQILGWLRYSGFFLALAMPSMLCMVETSTDILIIQIICLVFRPDSSPAEGFMCSKLPILRRLTSMGWLHALSRLMMYPLIILGLFIIPHHLGHYGLWIVALPLCAGYAWGVGHFRKLAKTDRTVY